MIPLFKRFPQLAASMPYAAIATLPTPVFDCPAMASEYGARSACIKCDGVSGADYGGNKVRKLAFLLGQAQAQGAQQTITFGAAGSNHALATAIYARKLGMEPVSMMVSQCNAYGVRRNLLRGLVAGATLKHFETRREISQSTLDMIVSAHRAGKPRPCIIPAGGSAPLGTVGFVDAGLELAEQIQEGALSVPDRIYVASGTMGTCVGLLIGLQLASLPTTVMAVRVTSPPFTSLARARGLYGRCVGLLRRKDPSFPALTFPEEKFVLRDGYLEPGYGRYSEAGMDGVAAARAWANLTLEGTYTGKAMACLMDDGRRGNLAGRRILFWNTYNAVSQHEVVDSADYRLLPPAFHRYYKKAVQDLDR